MSTTDAPAVLYGIRCTDPGHRGQYDAVYTTSPSETAMRSLSAGERCNEVVVSTDGGHSWARAEP